MGVALCCEQETEGVNAVGIGEGYRPDYESAPHVIVHGVAGAGTAEDRDGMSARFGREDTRRGELFEGFAGNAIWRWLASRPDEVHLFHDLRGFGTVEGGGFGPMSIGRANIDHLVLTGDQWLMIDSKGTAAGVLCCEPGEKARGMLVRPDGSCVAQPWMDSLNGYSAGALLFRLLPGLTGFPVWLVSAQTNTDHPSLCRSRCISKAGRIINLVELAADDLECVFPSGRPPADPGLVAVLDRYVSAPVSAV